MKNEATSKAHRRSANQNKAPAAFPSSLQEKGSLILELTLFLSILLICVLGVREIHLAWKKRFASILTERNQAIERLRKEAR